MLKLFKRLLALAEPGLVQGPKNDLSVLEHVFGVDVLDGVVSGVDVRVAVLERGLENERSRVSIPRGRAVVRASVSADAVDAFDVGIL